MTAQTIVGPFWNVSEWEFREACRRARSVRKLPRGTRMDAKAAIAADYGISTRTLERWLHYDVHSVKCAGFVALFVTSGKSGRRGGSRCGRTAATDAARIVGGCGDRPSRPEAAVHREAAAKADHEVPRHPAAGEAGGVRPRQSDLCLVQGARWRAGLPPSAPSFAGWTRYRPHAYQRTSHLPQIYP